MEEKTYKIYDSMYNVIGVAPYEEVHEKGLLHQVVHFWLVEREEDGLWLYIQKRADSDPIYRGAYDILTSGHIDPEETHEEALLHQIKEQLGLALAKEQLVHIGHINQKIQKEGYFDNAFVQSYLYVAHHPEKEFSGVEHVVKVKLSALKEFAKDPDGKISVYTVGGDFVEEIGHGQCWPRDEEFCKVLVPYITERICKRTA